MHIRAQRQHHVACLDGLRGVAAVVVVFSHFAGAFYPAILFNRPEQVHAGLESVIATTPVGLLFSGNLAVRLFFVLSGFVLTYQHFLRCERLAVAQAMLKRYLRLVLPIAASVLLAWGCVRTALLRHAELAVVTGSTNWLSTFWDVRPEFGAAVWNAFAEVLPLGVHTYNPVLWTMHYEFFGSLLVLALVLLLGELRLRYLVYTALIVAFFQTPYLAFLLGLVTADLIARRPRFTVGARFWLPLLTLGLYLGSYPSHHVQLADTIYAPLNWMSRNIPQTIGGLLILGAVLLSEPLQRVLRSRSCLILGRLSFSVYLIHMLVMCSLGAALFLQLCPVVGYHLAFLLMFPPTLVVVIGAAWLLDRYVDQPTIRLSRRLGRSAWRRRRTDSSVVRSSPETCDR